ncbi:MAG TPA: hypothetical protein VM095_21520 [Pyrinomonadaceae bacterium]|nr:hypothetical protein [Pyrinomonadaceae bacterium]
MAKTAKKDSSPFERGVVASYAKWVAAAGGPSVELFGHVTLVQGYALPQFAGCHALVALRDTPGKTVALMSSAHNLQTLLETALATGNLIAFRGSKSSIAPTPLGGEWVVDVYLINSLILYGFK